MELLNTVLIFATVIAFFLLRNRSNRLERFFYTLSMLGAAFGLQAASTTQDLTLQPGWNAVWLEVQPVYTSGDDAGLPQKTEDVFNDPDIERVARPKLALGTAEFIADQFEEKYNQADWWVWRRDSELNFDTLVHVEGNQPYLVHVDGSGPVNLSITGDVAFFTPTWVAYNYNLVGFSLTQAVTFSSFFAPADGELPVNKIFRLEANGDWVGVLDTDLMQPGEAYWIYADGPSDYVGPIAVRNDDASGLYFGAGPGENEVDDPDGGTGTILVSLAELTLRNETDVEQTVSLHKVAPSTSGPDVMTDDLRIYLMTPQLDSLDYAIGSQITDTPIATLPADETDTVTLGAHVNWSSGDRGRENLYRLVVGSQYFWLPMSAENDSLIDAEVGSDDPAYVGLWVGDVLLDRVSSLTETGNPVDATTSVAPLRILLHVDASGAVSLLSEVIVMQEKVVDADEEPDYVLVVNEEKIPLFEGIENRGNKRVGLRLESGAYDMPRKADIVTQAAIKDLVVDAGAAADPDNILESEVLTFINAQSLRPSDLVEDYYKSWTLDGGIGPLARVETNASQPLSLDAFHRSNPFRHAFHPQHGAGYGVERSFQLNFDANQPAGALTGDYQETISGLINDDITMAGRFELRRISRVGTLE
ncbi:hypothetical protein [Rubellicoccus peritrichatus]|uniref:Uncharacterized protein n=1 Tax=Rubellicoccus peritrichatus TaxID=3080537 RepID=A0AAQ3LCG3_9BACT|nr:hypothetical protein [Puniceicoccus sp. CR14]WOO41008.1 hypothetical protein RZN69_20505 [Puniceicoccus sp. CR14]